MARKKEIFLYPDGVDRRNNGGFYTPTIWVDYAHKMISEQIGENWKDEYVVWDNCCGSKNLTRDYRFKELYCSTLFESELEIGKRYNPEATSFQFDFLNDEIEAGLFGESKVPAGLLEAFKQNKKIVFLLNPPYASSSNIGDTAKKGLCNTIIGQWMKDNKIGASSQNLYAQFLYRIILFKQTYNLTNCNIALFSPTLFLTGQGYSNFRKEFLDEFLFSKGIQFRASHFADVADSWGISFSVWNSGINSNNFNYDIVDIDNNGEIYRLFGKQLYNVDNGKTSSEWLREETKKMKTFDVPNLTSAIKVRDGVGTRNGKCCKDYIGYFNNGGNNVDKNIQQVALFSSAYSGAVGSSIIAENFYKVVSLFSARKLIDKDWINSKDEYFAPNEQHPQFQEFVNDSIVYSLFHSSSNQSSLRQIEYHDKLWDIKNEFFWMSKSEIENLANEHNLDAIYNDARISNERFVYEKLKSITLSSEAQVVLNKASELVRSSFKYREMFSEEHPEYQLDKCWDAGFYQIKALLKEYMKDDLKEFQTSYKALVDKMRPQVYELGFLKKTKQHI